MSNNELTLDQLTAISGGVTRGPGGTTCTDRPLIKIIKKLLGPVTGPCDPPPIEEDLSEGTSS